MVDLPVRSSYIHGGPGLLVLIHVHLMTRSLPSMFFFWAQQDYIRFQGSVAWSCFFR